MMCTLLRKAECGDSSDSRNGSFVSKGGGRIQITNQWNQIEDDGKKREKFEGEAGKDV